MRKDKLYFLTFISIAFVFTITTIISTKYFIKSSIYQLIDIQLESSERESTEISTLIFRAFERGIDRDLIITDMQHAISNTQKEISFLSVFDWSGMQVCHPDITKVGLYVNSQQSLIESIKEKDDSEFLYDLLTSIQPDNKSTIEVINIHPIKNSDLIIASNINIHLLKAEVEKLKKKFHFIFILMGFLIIGFTFLAVRIIGSYYEKPLELKNSNLKNELINLTKLNSDLARHQQKIIENEDHQTLSPQTPLDASNKRLLSYVRNELIPINIDEIAYLFTENTITYIVSDFGKKSTINLSLDDLFNKLDPTIFFRANRQFIIKISSIQKINKYGNNQLKILVKNDPEVEILISKNKVAEFKQWLNNF